MLGTNLVSQPWLPLAYSVLGSEIDPEKLISRLGFGDAKIGHARSALRVYEDVLRLEISVHNVGVQIVQRAGDVLRKL